MSPSLATSFGIALPAWIVDQKNSMLVYMLVDYVNIILTDKRNLVCLFDLTVTLFGSCFPL